MSTYKTRVGDSPAIIARRHGTSVAALLTANPHKPTTVVAGKQTWQGLRPSERLNMPTGVGALGDDVGVGDATTDAINALVSAGGPCVQANVALVCAAQRALGVTVDGKWGSGSATAARSRGINAPACSPRPSWWAPVGQSNCTTTAAAAAPAASGSSLDRAAGAAYSTLRSDPNYCASVRRVGTAVNTAVHNFKAAWNAANPSRAVPIGTGNYEVSVAAALSSALGGIAVPPGCGAVSAAPTPAAGGGGAATPSGGGGAALPAGGGAARPATVPTAVPAAVLAVASINPCLQANSGTVYAAQAALGIVADGKYGPGTSAAVRALVPSAPAACSPAPMWWGAKGTAAATQAVQTAKVAAASATPSTQTASPTDQAKAATVAATAQATDATAKAAQASTQAQADAAAATAQAAIDAAARAAAQATTQAQADAAAAAAKTAQAALDAAAAKGGTTTGGGGAITPPEEKKGLSTGAIVAGALGAAALVGLVALAASGKTGTRGARGARGSRGRKATRRKPARRKSGSKRKKSSKRRR